MTFETYQNFLDQGSLVSLLCPPSSLPSFALSFTHSTSLRRPTIRSILLNWQACHSSWWLKRLAYLIPWRLNIYHVVWWHMLLLFPWRSIQLSSTSSLLQHWHPSYNVRSFKHCQQPHVIPKLFLPLLTNNSLWHIENHCLGLQNILMLNIFQQCIPNTKFSF